MSTRYFIDFPTNNSIQCVLKFREFEIDITAATAGMELIGVVRKAFQKISYAFADYALPKIILLPQERFVFRIEILILFQSIVRPFCYWFSIFHDIYVTF